MNVHEEESPDPRVRRFRVNESGIGATQAVRTVGIPALGSTRERDGKTELAKEVRATHKGEYWQVDVLYAEKP